jgi:hypothetical protein
LGFGEPSPSERKHAVDWFYGQLEDGGAGDWRVPCAEEEDEAGWARQARVELGECFDEALKTNPAATVGVPLQAFFTAARQLVEVRDVVIEMAMTRILLLLRAESIESMTAEEVLRAWLVDALRIFGKKEPHEARKLVRGGVRLIFGVSFIDNLIARFLHRSRKAEWKRRWPHIPAKPGLGMEDYHAVALLDGLKLPEDVVTCDVSGWDWTIQEWDYYNLIELCKRGACGTMFARAQYKKLVSATYLVWARAPLMTSAGHLIDTGPGVWASGFYTTSMDNSANRCFNHAIVARRAGVEPAIIANGDDSAERPLPPGQDPMSHYATLGKTLRDVREQVLSDFSFCSHRWRRSGPIHEAVGKALYKYMSAPTEEAMVGLMHAFRHRQDADALGAFMRSLLPPLPAESC